MQPAVKHKVVLLGDASVGKTSLILRYSKNTFVAYQESTIGAAFSQHFVPLQRGGTIRLDIWDTAGQERYASLAPMYYREAQGAIVVYDISSKDSFVRARDWVHELKKDARQDLIVFVVGNKVDLAPQGRRVTKEDGMIFAEETGCTFTETSAKTDIGIRDLFEALAAEINQHFPEAPSQSPNPTPSPIINPVTPVVTTSGRQKPGCC